ncbi:hypothetical protein EJ04DRAFT_605135 [Polyplosphaeria fusca]|uniref:Aminoglycoside phosphotransferase domain-containing protein n=1 Tax=Polyplosphaeria fusca TaxID=682080 RepID=A0A9P4V202_9PLEO|nr:hypothetical protein EJ04DRAFT_605135 [Polyplosphaeria fusca]
MQSDLQRHKTGEQEEQGSTRADWLASDSLGCTLRPCRVWTTVLSSPPPRPHIGTNRELFEYTSGRWIYNEPRRLAERRLAFNVDELMKAAAKSVNRRISDIKSFRKFAEGGFNRVFDISIKDGSCILARLPYPSTLPRRLAVASEVATLDFVRAHGIPTPRVLGYSVDDNPVGAEYILMEKVPGRPIEENERLNVVLQIVELETKLFDIHLPASGSIYYSHDLPPGTRRVDIPGSEGGLCIGPYASLRWWHGERADLDIDGGPQTFDYEKQHPEEHAKSLEDYIRLAPYLVPRSSKLVLPVLRHPDLQPNNIYVSEDYSITGLIDWQHSMVLPTFLAAGMPNLFQNYDDEESMLFVPPQLRDDFGSLDEDERAKAQESFRRRHRGDGTHWRALQEDGGVLKRRVFDDAGSPWEGLNTPLQMDIVRVVQNWSKIAAADKDGGIPACPVTLSEQEVQRRIILDEELREVDSETERINGLLGIAGDGWTTNEGFEGARERAGWIREEGLASVSDDAWLREMTERHWPFDDWDEDE